jgi:hypothetical protein
LLVVDPIEVVIEILAILRASLREKGTMHADPLLRSFMQRTILVDQ